MIINSQLGGKKPTGTTNITTNGVHNVADYEYADVSVPTTAPAHYIEKGVDGNGKLVGGSTFIDLTGVTDVGDYVLNYAFIGSTSLTSADMSPITTVSGEYACSAMCNNCSALTSVNLGGLISTSGSGALGNAFAGCYSLSNVNISSLQRIYGYTCCSSMFYNCPSLTSIDVSSVTDIGYAACNYMFGSTGLTSISFKSLTSISDYSMDYMLIENVYLESIYFWAITPATFSDYTNQFENLLNTNVGTSTQNGCTIHFPKNFDPSDPNHTFDASTLQGYPTFGGDASYIHLVYDLPSTFTLTGADTKSYERNPKYDTGTALAWYEVGTDRFTTQYYTSGLTDPAINDTIYSDSACVTSVTTISSIA